MTPDDLNEAESANGTAACAVSRVVPCSPIVAVPTDVHQTTLAELRAAGYVPIRTDNPDGVRLILAGSQVQSSDLLMSALHGMCRDPRDSKAAMVKELFRRLREREDSAANASGEPIATPTLTQPTPGK